MDPLCVSLVHQFLENTNSALVDQFKTRHKPKEISVKLEEVLSKWNEEQMARSVVYQHLKKVAPSLAFEFRINRICPLTDVPKQLVEFIKKSQPTQLEKSYVKEKEDEEKLEKGKTHTVPEVSGDCNISKCKNKAGMKLNTYTAEEVLRVEKAIENKEDIGALAIEMGRTYKSVKAKIYFMKKCAGLKTGKFTVVENERIRLAMENNDSYVSVAKELNRDPRTVYHRMLSLRSNPNPKQGESRGFTLEEDLLILDKVMPCLKYQKLSSKGFFSSKDVMVLATEFQRIGGSVLDRWELTLQPMLLQHYTGTSGFRVERMLTSLVAQKYKDHKGIDWGEIVAQHKEFAGHTNRSISHLFRNCQKSARRKINTKNASLQEVAEYATTYKPSKESSVKMARREKIVEHFMKRMENLGINVVV